MKIKLGKDALFLSILTLITVLVWMAFDIYRALTKTEVPQIIKEQLAPLNPELSFLTLDSLENRVSYSPDRLKEIRETVTMVTEVTQEEATSPAEIPDESNPGQPATESGILE